MKVYVDESIDDCFDCPCHNGENGNCKILNKFTDYVPKDCPLHSLTDHDQQIRADERKKVVEEIRKQAFKHFNIKDMQEYEKLPLIDSLFTMDTVTDILNQVEKGESNERNS